jgi:hypothetical protein
LTRANLHLIDGGLPNGVQFYAFVEQL